MVCERGNVELSDVFAIQSWTICQVSGSALIMVQLRAATHGHRLITRTVSFSEIMDIASTTDRACAEMLFVSPIFPKWVDGTDLNR